MPPPAASGGPSPFLQKPIVPGAQGARLCGRDTAALDKRDAPLNPRPVVPSSPRARLRPGRQAPRRICLASAQFPLQRRLFQPRSKRHSGSSRLPGPEWQESIQRAHHMLPRDSPHRLRPPSASVLLLAPRPRLGSRTLVPPPNSPHLLRAA